MKKITLLAIMVAGMVTSAQNKGRIRIPEDEFFIVQVHASFPKTHNPEANKYGLDYVIEAGYSGFVEAKVGMEVFESLVGGYKDFHGAVGFKLVHGRSEQYNYYVGIRLSKVYRENVEYGSMAYRVQPGFEASMTFDINDNFYWGLRYTYDKRYDMEINDWPVISVHSSFLTFGIKLKKL